MRRTVVTLLTVLLLGALAMSLSLAQAQQPPPSWKQGQPSTMAESMLAPIAQPPAPKAAGEIPVGKIKVPPGFKAELWASGINNARVMTWGSKGTLFVSSRVAGNVYAVVDKGSSREVKTIAKGLNLPNGVAFRDGTLYVAEIHRITKMVGIEDKLDNPPAMEVVYDTLPKDAPHGWKYLAFGPDGKLYFNIGAPCNICLPPDTHANLSRVNADGTGFEYCGARRAQQRRLRLASGDEGALLRHPRAATGWATMCRAIVSTWRRRRACTSASRTATRATSSIPEFGKGRSCGEFVPPLLKTGPHVAGNGVQFYTGSMFPPEYQNRIFLAQRGSWNRNQKIGFRVMMVTLGPGGVSEVRAVRRGVAAGRGDLGPAGLHAADEGWLAADRATTTPARSTA